MSHIFIFVSIFNKSIIKKILFRVFNPWRQIEKYDSECIYIKTWLPQLKDVPNKDILKWNEILNMQDFELIHEKTKTKIKVLLLKKSGVLKFGSSELLKK